MALDIRWGGGKLIEATLTPLEDTRLTVIYGGRAERCEGKAGEEIRI
jgi:hypothetical protein